MGALIGGLIGGVSGFGIGFLTRPKPLGIELSLSEVFFDNNNIYPALLKSQITQHLVISTLVGALIGAALIYFLTRNRSQPTT